MLFQQSKLQLFYGGVRMSVQRSYSILLYPSSSITINQYRIFKHFVVHGYKLYRHQKNTNFKETDTTTTFECDHLLPTENPYGK